MRTIWRGAIVTEEGIIEQGEVIAEEGTITYVGEEKSSPLSDDDVLWTIDGGWLLPGLIDLHVHGAGGADVMDGSEESLNTIARTLLAHGVTGFLGTTVTAPEEQLVDVLRLAARWRQESEGATMHGIHLEGPWISTHRCGAQNPEHVRAPDLDEARRLVAAAQGILSVVTLAPERAGAEAVMDFLTQQGIALSIGHTEADDQAVLRAMNHGASRMTHLFNAMDGIHHRRVGTALMGLLEEDLVVEVIADGIHLSPAMVRLIARTKGPDHTLLISDGMRAVGMPDGRYTLGELDVDVTDGRAALTDGTLAGSVLTLKGAVNHLADFARWPLWRAVRTASLLPARLLGLEEILGSIAVRKRAHVFEMDRQGQVRRVWMDGKLVHGGGQS